MQTKKTHWASLLTLLIFAISIMFFLLIVTILGISSLFDLINNNGEPIVEMIGAAAFGFVIVLLLVCGWFVLQKTMGREKADHPFILPFASWHLIPVIGLIFTGLLTGGLAAYSEIPWLGWLVMPTATILVIIPPIWLIFGYGSRELEAGPRWRVFAVFGFGMTIGPVIMVILEMISLFGIIIAGIALLAILEPATLQDVMKLADIVQTETNEAVLLNLFAPYISNPLVIATGIG